MDHSIKEIVGAIHIDAQAAELFLDLTNFRCVTLPVSMVGNPITSGCPLDEGVAKASEEQSRRKAPMSPQKLHNPFCPLAIVRSPIVGEIVACIDIVYDRLD
jgi:hypothetical protein